MAVGGDFQLLPSDRVLGAPHPGFLPSGLRGWGREDFPITDEKTEAQRHPMPCPRSPTHYKSKMQGALLASVTDTVSGVVSELELMPGGL